MSTEDTNSIKYILDEMDPAEMIEFERKMEKDPDLRIEVESIKRMKARLDMLPDLTPPEHITNSILTTAAEQSNQKTKFKTGYFLSAAVVILGLTTGSLILQNGNQNSNGTPSEATISGFTGSSISTQNSHANVKPWVDNKDILRLSGFDSASQPFPISEFGNSIEKLRPVGTYPDFQPVNRSLQLTGSNR